MAEPQVHPTAIVSDQAELGEDVVIGPFCLIEGKVKLGKGTIVDSHSVIKGVTVIGENCRIGHHAAVGADSQDKTYSGEESYLFVGKDNFFGDFTQITRGTSKTEDRATHIGDNNYIMSYGHVGHDSIIQNNVTIASLTALGGHVLCEDNSYVGGGCVLHQFIRVGTFAMISGGTACPIDIPPYVRVAGYTGPVVGLNTIGLKRSGKFSDEERANLKALYKAFFIEGGNIADLFPELRARFPGDKNVDHFCTFVETSKRGVTRARKQVGASNDDD